MQLSRSSSPRHLYPPEIARLDVPGHQVGARRGFLTAGPRGSTSALRVPTSLLFLLTRAVQEARPKERERVPAEQFRRRGLLGRCAGRPHGDAPWDRPGAINTKHASSSRDVVFVRPPVL